MLKIFTANKTDFPSSQLFLEKILRDFYGEKSFTISRGEHGKPYATGINRPDAKFFSITHTSDRYFIAFSQTEIGIDAELLTRTGNVSAMKKKFPIDERKEIKTTHDFLMHWTAKESIVKYFGSTIYKGISKIALIGGQVYVDGILTPLSVQHTTFNGHLICVCQAHANADIEKAFCTLNTL